MSAIYGDISCRTDNSFNSVTQPVQLE